MPSQRRPTRQRRLAAFGSAMVLASLLAVQGAPAAFAVDPSALLEITWTRPGTSEVFSPPATLQMGDEVTVHIAMTGFFQPGCQTVFAGGGADHNYPSMWIFSEAWATGGCPDWTFVVPRSPMAEYRIETAVFEGMNQVREVVPIVMAPGGTHVPFASNYPVSSWSPEDLFGTEPLTFGEPITVPVPPSASRCQLGFNGTFGNGFRFNADDCAPWSLTVPELRPAFSTSGEFAWPWQTGVMVSADAMAPDGRRLNGTTYAIEVDLDGDGTATTFASSEPAGLFQASTNPYFFQPGEVPLTPTLVGITSGSCEYKVKTPSDSGFALLETVAIVDGQCPPATVDAEELGGYQYDLRILDEDELEVAHTWASFVVTPPIPPPTIELPPDPPDPGEDVPIEVSVSTGPATDYSVSVQPEGLAAADAAGVHDTAAGVAVSATTCTNAAGQLDVLQGDRNATATCRFGAAGRYKITARMTDALGTIRTTSKPIDVGGDTVAPTTTKPTTSLVKGTTAADGRTPVKFAWSGSDATSGVHHYHLALSTDNAAYSFLSTSLTTASFTKGLAPGHTYRVRARAVDRAGNVGAWVAGPAVRLAAQTEAPPRVSYGGAWATASGSGFLGGSARRVSTAGSSATYAFSGRSVAWLASMGPTYGKVRVLVDGVNAGTVDLYRASGAARQIVFTRSWSTSGSHTLRLVNLGTPGRPTAIVDGFFSLIGPVAGSVSVVR